MAYFDSPKNRAKWDRRLAGLREEKIRRQEEGYQPQEQKKEVMMEASNNPFRRKINFTQLEEIERKSMEANRVRRPGRAARREMEGARREINGMEKSGPEKKGMVR